MSEEDKSLNYCSICGKYYSRELYARSCEKGHDVVYVPIKREDLFKLVQFFYTKDESLLSENLIKTIMKYRKNL